ncbi:hypothetical protein JXM67_12070 [candidate division WOR-3 bacterium]|nr:hypothetical protein [candidate division WOR-3 bacterium]
MKKMLAIMALAALLACTQGPAPPELIYPYDGVSLTTIPFTWTSVEGASEYRLEICKDEGFVTPNTIDETTTDTTYKLPTERWGEFEDGTIYYWRVSSGDEAAWGKPSLVRTFNVMGGGK